MKKFFLALTFSWLMSINAFAAATPIKEAVDFSNEKFAELVTKALHQNIRGQKVMRAGGWSMIYRVASGLVCMENHGFSRPGASSPASYSCAIYPEGGWAFMGMESYGSGRNEAFSKTLYDALDVAETREEDFTSKQIEFNEESSSGGTDRNQLVCLRPTKRGEDFVKHSCQLINNL
jgi:hypothetical protein